MRVRNLRGRPSRAPGRLPPCQSHRTVIPVILERSRRRSNAAAVPVVQHVPFGNSPQQRHVVGALRIVRKPGLAFIRRNHLGHLPACARQPPPHPLFIADQVHLGGLAGRSVFHKERNGAVRGYLDFNVQAVVVPFELQPSSNGRNDSGKIDTGRDMFQKELQRSAQSRCRYGIRIAGVPSSWQLRQLDHAFDDRQQGLEGRATDVDRDDSKLISSSSEETDRVRVNRPPAARHHPAPGRPRSQAASSTPGRHPW